MCKKNVLFITGTRADYGKLQPLAISLREANFKVVFFVTGMHMLAAYGRTVDEVKKNEDINCYEFVNQRNTDKLDVILSKTVSGLSDYISENPVDLIVAHGDRVESLAACLVGSLNNIRVAHIEGGEVTGTIDESIRHCNSKLSTVHFVCNNRAKQNLQMMGESSDRIFLIGSPELDIHKKPSGLNINHVKEYYNIPFDEYGIVTFHPVVTELDTMYEQADSLFCALERSGKNYVVILPNNDPGSDIILARIKKLNLNQFRIIPTMRFLYFSELMKNCSIFIGNSSACVREAPFMGVPTINIGSRQNKRNESKFISNYMAGEIDAIVEVINAKWGSKQPPDLSFGDGDSISKFVKIINSYEFWMIPIQKFSEFK